MALLVGLGTVLTHLFGGSVGREGTRVQIGGTIGNLLSKAFKCNDIEKRILLISGVLAGFSYIFGTPLAVTIFAVEISKIGSISHNSFLSAITVGIIGDKVVRFLSFKHKHYKIPLPESVSILNIGKVVLLAICFGLTSKLFVYLTHLIKDALVKYFKNAYIKVFVGGVLMTLSTLIIGNRLYTNLSLELLNDAFDGTSPKLTFIIKLLLTALCLAAGYQGGEVTALFVMGQL